MPEISILGITLPQTAALAPMAGVADRAYRQLCCEMGAVMCVSEMISAKGLYYDSNARDVRDGSLLTSSKGSAALCRISDAERPMGLQLFGSEPEFIARAAALLAPFSPDWIDLNMGCPVHKVIQTGAGSALLKTPDVAAACVRAAVQETDVPVTVKMRIGWDQDSINAVEFAQYMEDAGAAALTVHGRTKAMLYSGKADWEVIRQVKAAVSIPVIGNGDVTDAASCEAMYRETGVDLVAVGRASYGNPWIFREIACAREGLPYVLPTPQERMEMMLRHVRLILEYSDKPQQLAIREARKQTSWYMQGSKNAAAFRSACFRLNSYAEAEALAEEYVRANS